MEIKQNTQIWLKNNVSIGNPFYIDIRNSDYQYKISTCYKILEYLLSIGYNLKEYHNRLLFINNFEIIRSFDCINDNKTICHDNNNQGIQRKINLENLYYSINESLKVSDLNAGEFYTSIEEGKEDNNIFQYSHSNVASYYTSGNRNGFCKNGGNFSGNIPYRKATNFEKNYLKAMIKENEFIKEEQFAETYQVTYSTEPLNLELALW